ncbi:MAG: glycosyltransferase [Candidatus Methanoperedens sp.]|nr:glycosyltransferase [Candidatus Methanoperedens sp.]
MENIPFISIIVPVYNGESIIDECINSLLNLNYPINKYELIIVDNNSKDNTSHIISKYPVKYALETKKGSYAARNKGIKLAEGEILLFTDSDCIADKDWIINIIKPFRDSRVGAVGGKTITYNPTTIVEKYLESISALDNESSIKSKRPSIATANAAFRKNILGQVGFFDETFTSGGDYDISWRIHNLGYILAYEHNSIIFHKHGTDFKSLFNKEFRYGCGNVQLFKKHFDKNRFRLGGYVQILYTLLIQIPFRFLSVILRKRDKMMHIAVPFCILIRNIGYKSGMIYGCIKYKTIYL